MSTWGELIPDGEGGQITIRSAEAREAIWEQLDALTHGQVFVSRQVWEWAGRPSYIQVGITLRRALKLGYIKRLSRTKYYRAD